jgi:RHS repeat-associated protein
MQPENKYTAQSFFMVNLTFVFYAKMRVDTDFLSGASMITNSQGQMHQTLAYTPFGEDLINVTVGGGNGIINIGGNYGYQVENRFTGYIKDNESGLNYATNRYYWSEGGIFTSTDQLWHKFPHLTSYHYCENNPINNVDRDGRWSGSIHKEFIMQAVKELRNDGILNVTDKEAKVIINAMVRGSNIADSSPNQTAERSYIHYMRDPNVSTEQAKQDAQNYVNINIAEFQRTGNYELLGQASHTMMDAVSPSHATKNTDGSYEPKLNNLGYNPVKWTTHIFNELLPTESAKRDERREAVDNVKNVLIEGLKNKPQQQQSQGVGLIDQ